MRKKLTAILILALLASLLAYPAAADGQISDQPMATAADLAAAQEVLAFATSGDPMVTWTTATTVARRITLTDFAGNVNGYIYDLTTDGQPTGFIQVNLQEGEFVPFALGFEGDNYLVSQLKANGLYDTAGIATAYYAQGLNYYVPSENGQLVDLLNKDVVEMPLATLQTQYTAYLTQRQEEIALQQANEVAEESILPRSTISYSIYFVSVAASQYRSASYYRNQLPAMCLANHCTPTAATNMVLYWSLARNQISLNDDDIAIFVTLHEAMGTTATDNTPWANINPAISDYFELCNPSLALEVGYDETVTYNEVKQIIDRDIPVLMHIGGWSYDQQGNPLTHTVNVWGYRSDDSGDYYRITHNQDSTDTVAFSFISTTQYTNYIRYDYAGYDF